MPHTQQTQSMATENKYEETLSDKHAKLHLKLLNSVSKRSPSADSLADALHEAARAKSGFRRVPSKVPTMPKICLTKIASLGNMHGTT